MLLDDFWYFSCTWLWKPDLDYLSINLPCGTEPDIELPEGEIPDLANKLKKNIKLMTMLNDIDTEKIKKWQPEDLTCKAMMAWWIVKYNATPSRHS